MTALKQLQAKFPQFTWTQENKRSDISGNMNVPQLEKRINKDLYQLSNIRVFISSKMGGTPLSGKPFRYAMCYQSGRVRPYRCKNTFGVEFNKVFVSGVDLQDTINKLTAQIDMNNYYLTKKDLVESK